MANALAEFFNVALQVAHLTQRPVDFNASCLAFLFCASAVVAACAGCRAGLAGVLCVRQVPAALLRACGAGRLFVRRGARRRGPCRPHGGRTAAPVAGRAAAPPPGGGFDLSAQAAARRWSAAHGPIPVLYRPARQAWLARLMATARNRPGMLAVPTTLAGVRQMLLALRRGEAVGLLPDQVPPAGQGHWAPFFGRDAYTMTL